jgi:mRNA-degrading endonuclease RelE of RelBE toxin-antitoxin system
MQIIRTDDFNEMSNRLSPAVRRTLEAQLRRFGETIRHPSLQTKKLVDMDGVYSIRVGRSYRALFFFLEKDTTVFFAIGHRKGIYR